MHIGIDTRLWNETGVGRYIRNLVQNLQKIDTKNSYTLFSLSKDKKNIQFQISNDKFQIVTADIRWHSIEEQLQFTEIIKKQDVDLMHFPYFSVPIFYNRPFVITVHDLILHHFPTGEASQLPYLLYRLKLEAYKFIIQQAATRAKKIITVSEATKQEILDHLRVGKQKIAVTVEGTDSSVTMSQAKKPQIADPYFLHVGNLYPHKNMRRLVEAFSLFLRSYPKPVKLVIVGKKDFFTKKFVSLVHEKNLKDSVIFYHEVSDSELGGLYTHAVATVVPSLMEGFGLPAVEAMANRCLVIASDIPSLREVCEDAGVYIDPYNTADIAEKLVDTITLSEEDRGKKIEEGVVRVSRYSWEKMGKETLAVYESCIGL